MRDPHVVDLTYTLITDPGISYMAPSPVDFQTPVARFRLCDGVLTVTMNEHFASVADAKAAVAGVLSAWELRTAIVGGRGCLSFNYDRPTVIDRTPPQPEETQNVLAEGMSTAVFSGHLDRQLRLPQYPDPPDQFVRTPEVDALSARWLAYRANQEPLLSAAYYIVTHLQQRFVNAAGAAASLGISRKVIDKLHAIAGGYGDEKTARKAVPNAKPLTGEHARWVERVIPQMLLRLAQLPIAAPTQILTMADFPALPD